MTGLKERRELDNKQELLSQTLYTVQLKIFSTKYLMSLISLENRLVCIAYVITTYNTYSAIKTQNVSL